jgi:hypothetical protein
LAAGASTSKLSSVNQMSLAVGEKLGPYEILAPISKVGMGEVYRAHEELPAPLAAPISRCYGLSREFLDRVTQCPKAAIDA